MDLFGSDPPPLLYTYVPRHLRYKALNLIAPHILRKFMVLPVLLGCPSPVVALCILIQRELAVLPIPFVPADLVALFQAELIAGSLLAGIAYDCLAVGIEAPGFSGGG